MDEIFKEIFQNLKREIIKVFGGKLQKELYLAPLIRELEKVDISVKELIPPTGTGNRVPTEITKKIYELELEKH